MNLQQQVESIDKLEGISINAEAVTGTGQSAKNVFCQSWPVAKTVLEAISNMIKNPMIKVSIGIIIRVGDAMHERICG